MVNFELKTEQEIEFQENGCARWYEYKKIKTSTNKEVEEPYIQHSLLAPKKTKPGEEHDWKIKTTQKQGTTWHHTNSNIVDFKTGVELFTKNSLPGIPSARELPQHTLEILKTIREKINNKTKGISHEAYKKEAEEKEIARMKNDGDFERIIKEKTTPKI